MRAAKRRIHGAALAALLLLVATSWPAAAKARPAAGAAGSGSPLLATVDVGLGAGQDLDVGTAVASAADVELALEAPSSWTHLNDLARFAEEAKWRLEVDSQELLDSCLEPRAGPKTRVRGYQLFGGGNEASEIALSVDVSTLCVLPSWGDQLTGLFVTADPLGYVDGPSMYAFAGFDPVNNGDPLGLYIVGGRKELEYMKSVLRNLGLDEYADRLKPKSTPTPKESRYMIPEFWRSITGDAPPMETRIVNDNAGWKEEPLTGDAQEVAAMIDSLIDAETRVEVRIGPSDKAISAGGGVAYGTHSPTAMNVEVDISALDAMVPAQFADGKIGETSIESIEMALVHELGHAYAKVTGASPWYSAELFYAVYYENVYRRGTAQEPGKQPIRILERPRRGDDPLEGLTYDERATMELMIDRFRRNPDENQK